MELRKIIGWIPALNFTLALSTVCPRSSGLFYIVTYYIKWITTSWTYIVNSLNIRQRNVFLGRKPLFKVIKYYYDVQFGFHTCKCWRPPHCPWGKRHPEQGSSQIHENLVRDMIIPTSFIPGFFTNYINITTK